MTKLTPSQTKIYDTLSRLLSEEKVVCLTGNHSSGKKLIGDLYINSLPPSTKVLTVNVIDLIPNHTYSLYDLRLSLEEVKTKAKSYDLLYLREFERSLLISTSYRFKMAVDVGNLFIDFLNSLETKTIAICSISNGRSLVNENIWAVQLKIKDEDRKMIINEYTTLPEDQREKVISYSKGNTIKEIMIGIKRANRLYEFDSSKEWIDYYLEILAMLETYCVNIDRIENPKLDVDMVGLEHVIEIIENDVIKPIELNDKLIPLCRGILLYGPPGTGKTTVCRWIVHRLKGKVFSVEHDPDVPFSSSLKKAIDKAIANAPSIVIIDEMSFDEIYKRPVLTLLDGISSNDMSRITLVASTMDISKMCESYIRGRRFERCIKFEYPNIDMIYSIIERRFQIAVDGLLDKHPSISDKLKPCLIKNNIKYMASTVTGCSPATIHYTIDVVIRTAASSKETYDPIKTFENVADDVKSVRNRTCKILDTELSDDRLLYT